MLQIIGWLGCLYLFVKSLEILSSRSHRDDENQLTAAATSAVAAGICGSIGFALWLGAQGDAASSAMSFDSGYDAPAIESSLTDEQVDCINSAATVDETLACTN